jgi:CRP/FNR family transcriptional regulator, cyclic AMP receptor protein
MMQVPYGLELTEDCAKCTERKDGFFCQLPSASLQAMSDVKYTSTYPAGAILYVEGQPSRGVYMLCKGRVKMTMTAADGKTVILNISEPGELLGLNAVISNKPYEVTLEALQPCQVNFIRRDDFLKILKQDNSIAFATLHQISNSLHSACNEIRYLGLSRTAAEKVARFLLELAIKGQETNLGKRFNLGLTHEEISQVVGTSRETVTRTLTQFKTRSLITMKGSTVVIRDEPALKALVAA